MKQTTINFLKRQLIYTLVFSLVFQPMAYGQVVVDPSEGNIYLDESVNGVPIVGINAPTNGISQNQFSDYNLNKVSS